MEIVSILVDKRINAANILVEFTIGEYLESAVYMMKNNPFQRKLVKSSSTVYSLLRDDLKVGCIIPPIVLALHDDDIPPGPLPTSKEQYESSIKTHIKNALILDGLQRTNNIVDANEELEQANDKNAISAYHNFKIRCEFYFGINKIGILYRMLTLNTGQTPMSIRHQIEILYSDYLDQSFEGIQLIKETEGGTKAFGRYPFKDIIEGFTSYIMREYLTFDRADLLENIKGLEKLSKENQGADLFKVFLELFHLFLKKMIDTFNGWTYRDGVSEYTLTTAPFGRDIFSVFGKSQILTGLGAAIGFLTDKELSNFEKVKIDIEKIKIASSGENAMYLLLYKLDTLRVNASKIGNAQREFFFYFFRELFNSNGDSYLEFENATELAYKRYTQNA